MRFLIDEMFSSEVAAALAKLRHDASHVADLGLRAARDSDVLARAAEEDRVVVTENAADFVPLLDERVAGGSAVVPVVIALKRALPTNGSAMSHALAKKLDAWVQATPDPYRHVHWLG